MPEVDPAGTETVAGTVTPAALLERPTVAPPAGAALDNITEQLAAAPGAKTAGEQETDVTSVLAFRAKDAVTELPL